MSQDLSRKCVVCTFAVLIDLSRHLKEWFATRLETPPEFRGSNTIIGEKDANNK